MPYIPEAAKKELDFEDPTTPGELNYCLTMLCKRYWGASHTYQKLNDIIGALEGAKLEFYRRVAAPYEDGKINQNGDVY